MFCSTYSALLPIPWRQQPQALRKWMAVAVSNEMLLMDSDIGISYIVHMSWNNHLLLRFYSNHWTMWKLFLASLQVGFGPQAVACIKTAKVPQSERLPTVGVSVSLGFQGLFHSWVSADGTSKVTYRNCRQGCCPRHCSPIAHPGSIKREQPATHPPEYSFHVY